MATNSIASQENHSPRMPVESTAITKVGLTICRRFTVPPSFHMTSGLK